MNAAGRVTNLTPRTLTTGDIVITQQALTAAVTITHAVLYGDGAVGGVRTRVLQLLEHARSEVRRGFVTDIALALQGAGRTAAVVDSLITIRVRDTGVSNNP